MYHGYGPAETTIGVSHVIYRGAAERLSTSIGKANPNTQLYVLDDELRPVPVGVGGELYVGGFLLGRGYVNAPGLTASRFVANPFAEDGSRLYRTGDLARFAPDGSLDFLGRADNQIKIRGMRLEIEDVEVGLAEHPGVRHTCVVAKKNTAGGTYLVGYVIPAAGSEELRADEVRAWAAAHMVEYMVPAHVVVMKEFPLTANGKLDRRALPEPAIGTGSLVPPTTENERVVCAAVAEVLRLDEVGVDQDFFQLGGDSILAISLLSALRDAGLHVTARQIFTHSTVGALAAVASREDAATVDDGDVATGAVVGIAHRAVARRDHRRDRRLRAVGRAEHPGGPDRRRPRRDPRRRGRAARHAARPAGARRPLELRHPGGGPGHGRCGRRATGRSTSASRSPPTGWTRTGGVMLRAVWRREARQLVLVVHHVVIDGVSWRVLMDDLATAWRQFASGTPIELPAGGHVVPALDAAAGAAPRSTRTAPTTGVPCRARTDRWAGARCPAPTPSRGSGCGPSRSAPRSRPRCWARSPRGSTRASTTCC